LNLLFTALLMLCGLGAAIFATSISGRRNSFHAIWLGFGSAAVLIRPEALPNAGWTGCIVAGVAALRIFRPDVRLLTPLCAGALAGLWSVLLQIQGLPWPAAIAAAASVPALSAFLSIRSPAFAPEALREEAMLAMLFMGFAVAVIPEVSAGWQSALALNREDSASTNRILANWVLVLSGASIVLGGLYSLLRRR
jgi:hypothetical protein